MITKEQGLSNVHGNNVLIIEDSLATIILVKEFLKKLGYENVHYSQNGNEGIVLFKKLVKEGKNPLVFLDYELGDTDGLTIIKQLLEIEPSTKVIIETASERTEEPVKKLLSCGAYDYLVKPIRFKQLEEILQTLNDESCFTSQDEKVYDIIQYMIKSSTQLSFAKVVETTHLKPEIISDYLNKLVSENLLRSIGTVKEVSCSCCESVNTGQIFYCPSCNSTNFKQGRLMEHYDCGYVALSDEFKNNVCPQCSKSLKARGVDHKCIENYHICQECGNKFPEPYSKFVCNQCNKRFSIEEVKWVSSPGFEVIKPKTDCK